MNTLNRHNPLLWLGLLLLAWLVLGVQLAAPKVASGPFYAATEHHLGVTRWEAAPRLGLDAWTADFASGDTVVPKGAPDFYTNSLGETIPSVGYRYVSSDAPYLQELLSTGKIPGNSRGTYISFDNIESGAAGKLQVPHDAAIKIEFDTKQILDDVSIPTGQWGKADYPEPITTDFPQFGPGGATQAVTTKPISVSKIIDTKTGEVIYERGE